MIIKPLDWKTDSSGFKADTPFRESKYAVYMDGAGWTAQVSCNNTLHFEPWADEQSAKTYCQIHWEQLLSEALDHTKGFIDVGEAS